MAMPWFLMLDPLVAVIGGSFATYLAITRPDAAGLFVADTDARSGALAGGGGHATLVASAAQLELAA